MNSQYRGQFHVEDDLDLRLTDGGELTEAYAVENGEVTMTRQELITMIENAGLKPSSGIRCIIE